MIMANMYTVEDDGTVSSGIIAKYDATFGGSLFQGGAGQYGLVAFERNRGPLEEAGRVHRCQFRLVKPHAAAEKQFRPFWVIGDGEAKEGHVYLHFGAQTAWEWVLVEGEATLLFSVKHRLSRGEKTSTWQEGILELKEGALVRFLHPVEGENALVVSYRERNLEAMSVKDWELREEARTEAQALLGKIDEQRKELTTSLFADYFSREAEARQALQRVKALRDEWQGAWQKTASIENWIAAVTRAVQETDAFKLQAIISFKERLVLGRLPELVNPRLTTIETITLTTLTVDVVDEIGSTSARPTGRQLLVVDGEILGVHDNSSLLKRSECPFQLPCWVLELSDGTRHRVAEKPLFAHRAVAGKSWVLSRQEVVSFTLKIGPEFSYTRASFAELVYFKAGDVLRHDYPFQWLGEKLTVGKVSFPRKRPQGSEWGRYTISAIPEGLWDYFLEALEGKFLDDLLSFHAEFIARPKRTRVKLTDRQTKVRQIIDGVMWDGHKEAESVSIGQNLVFVIVRESDKACLYVVDNPGIGALYVIDDKEIAYDLACGRKGRMEVRELGYPPSVHRGEGWRERLTERLREWKSESSVGETAA